MCKGKVIYIKNKNYSFVCYAGDGSNDFCPMQKLTQNDLAFALEKKIPKMKESRGLEVTAEIHYWTTGRDILAQIEKILESI